MEKESRVYQQGAGLSATLSPLTRLMPPFSEVVLEEMSEQPLCGPFPASFWK
jgi:hypothetical protein